MPKTIVEFVKMNGEIPFRVWLESIKDNKVRALIDARLTRVRLGNLGHCRSVGGGVMKLKIDFGPGYRVYFGQEGRTIVVLLVGGNKKSQMSDIKNAREFWNEYRE